MPAAKTKVQRRTQQERRETTRRLLLEAAIDCICELGFPGATLEVITQRAGVTRGAVQHHFGTRDELLLAVVVELNEKLSAHSDPKLFADKPMAERLASICEQLWEIVSSRHFVAAVHIQLGTATDPQLSPRVLKIMVKIEKDLDERWVELFANDGLAPAHIVATRHVAQATLRGLVIKQIYRKRQDNVRTERALLLQMLQHAFRQGRRSGAAR